MLSCLVCDLRNIPSLKEVELKNLKAKVYPLINKYVSLRICKLYYLLKLASRKTINELGKKVQNRDNSIEPINVPHYLIEIDDMQFAQKFLRV